jgi:hypothetical protein
VVRPLTASTFIAPGAVLQLPATAWLPRGATAAYGLRAEEVVGQARTVFTRFGDVA